MGVIKNLIKAFNVMAKGAPTHGYWPIFDEGVNVTSQFRTTRDYLSASQMISWVNVCCSRIGTRCAMTPWRIYDAEGEESTNEDLLALLKNPNPYQTNFEFVELIHWHLLLAGNAYIYKLKENLFDVTAEGKYSQLLLFRPDCCRPELTDNGIVGYRVSFSYGEKIIPTTDILHIKEPNPMDSRVGMGKIQANEMLYNTEYSAQNYNWLFFAKGGRPATALEIPGDLNADQIKELEARFEKYRGVNNSHKVITLTNGMKVTSIGVNQKDMEFIEQRKFSREEILAIFGMPPGPAGVLEYSNYANLKEQYQILDRDTIEPRNIKIANAFTRGIIRDFEKNPKKPVLRYEYETVVRRDDELYMKLATQGIQNSLLTPNEARDLYLDLPKDDAEPAMDAYNLPINMIPIADSGSELPPAPGKGAPGIKKVTAAVRQAMYRASMNTRKKIGKTIKKEMKTFFDEQETRVLAALAAQKSLDMSHKLSADDIFKLSADDIFNYEREKEELLKRIRKGHAGVMLRAIDDANNILGTSVDGSTGNPSVVAGIAKLAQKVTVVNKTTKDKIEAAIRAIDAAIRAGVDAGESISELKNRIETVFVEARGYRAEMIARTESASAYDRGSILSYKEAEIEFVDVFGCEDNVPDCNTQHIPIDEADALEFHPNHTGVILPEVS